MRPSGLPVGTASVVVYMISGSLNAASAQRSGVIDMPALTASQRPALRPGMRLSHATSSTSMLSTPSAEKISLCIAIVAPVGSPDSSTHE